MFCAFLQELSTNDNEIPPQMEKHSHPPIFRKSPMGGDCPPYWPDPNGKSWNIK